MKAPKTVLITGSTSGIGLGIAEAYAKAGYQIVFNGLEANGEEVAAEVAQRHGIKAIFSNANMLDPEAIKGMFAQAERHLGGVDVLINNAGIQHVSPIDEFPAGKWDAIIGINLSSAFHTTQAAWPHMKKQGFGRIINIASAHGLRASAFKSAYVAAKHGVVGLTKVLALEGAPFGITANAICPGYVRTPLVDGQIADTAKAHNISEQEAIENVILEKHAYKEFVTVELIAQLSLFLASEAANTMTGTALPVDGGWTAK